MCPLQALEARRLTVELRAEHTENAAGAGIAFVVYLGIREIILPDVCPHIVLHPERHGFGCWAFGIVCVAAIIEPMLRPNFGFRRHRSDDGNPSGFAGVSFHGFLFHGIAALVADFEGRVEQEVPLIRDPEFAAPSILFNAV